MFKRLRNLLELSKVDVTQDRPLLESRLKRLLPCKMATIVEANKPDLFPDRDETI